MKRGSGRHKTRCPECLQWRVVQLVRGTGWWLYQHQRPAFRGSVLCGWQGGLVSTAIIFRGMVVREALGRATEPPAVECA